MNPQSAHVNIQIIMLYVPIPLLLHQKLLLAVVSIDPLELYNISEESILIETLGVAKKRCRRHGLINTFIVICVAR